MSRIIFAAAIATLLAFCTVTGTHGARLTRRVPTAFSATPVIDWSNEARKAIVPAGPKSIFGIENYGDKFPGEAAIYMGIVHAAIYDAAVAIEGGYRPYAIALTAPEDTSPAAAIATAAHHVLIDLGLTPAQQKTLNDNYTAYLRAIAEGPAKANGIAIGTQVALAVLATREDDGRDRNPQPSDLNPPPPGPGVWDEGLNPAVGLRVPGIRPLVLQSGAQFRPGGPPALASDRYAKDFQQVAAIGRLDSDARRPHQTSQALFWTDHDIRQWNDGILKLAGDRRLDLVQTARLLAMAHAAGGDAMIACFDAKYSYWFWRPYQAIPRADEDSNAATVADPTWQPLGTTTPNFPEYPSAHACHTSAVATALGAFFGTDEIPFSLDSRVTRKHRRYKRFDDAVTEVNQARVLVGFHFRTSDLAGSHLGQTVAQYVVTHQFTPSN